MKKWILITCVSVAVSIVGYFIVRYLDERDMPFDSQRWQLGGTAQTLGGDIEPFRHRMVNDLFDKHLLSGKTKPEVVNLLGSDGSEVDGNLYYWLNEEYACFICIDPTRVDNLVIVFDSNQRVKKSYVESYSHK